MAVTTAFSSFTNKELATTYYFDIKNTFSIPTGSPLFDFQVTRRANYAINPGDICVGATKLCIVGFLTSQLTANKVHLNTDLMGSSAPIYPSITISTRN